MAAEVGTDLNNLAYWYPALAAAGVPTPTTHIVAWPGRPGALLGMLDGEEVAGFIPFLAQLLAAVGKVGSPCFMRTGHTSGKHSWARTCYLPAPTSNQVAQHVGALVEYSAMADFVGLPVDTWAVRELLPTVPLFKCTAYAGFPVVREFRLFVRDAPGASAAPSYEVVHLQPYWPPGACEQGQPDVDDWRGRLEQASLVRLDELDVLRTLAHRACAAVGGGYWSVDCIEVLGAGGMQGLAGTSWYVTDMAVGSESYKYDPATGKELEP